MLPVKTIRMKSADEKFPDAFGRMYANQSEANQRQVNPPAIGDVTAPPVGTIFAFELEERFIAVNMVEIFKKKLNRFFFRHELGGGLFCVSKGSKA